MVAVASLHHLACQDRFMLYLQLFLDPDQRQFSRQNSLRHFQGKRRGIESNKEKGFPFLRKTILLPQDLRLI